MEQKTRFKKMKSTGDVVRICTDYMRNYVGIEIFDPPNYAYKYRYVTIDQLQDLNYLEEIIFGLDEKC